MNVIALYCSLYTAIGGLNSGSNSLLSKDGIKRWFGSWILGFIGAKILRNKVYNNLLRNILLVNKRYISIASYPFWKINGVLTSFPNGTNTL